MDIEGLFALEEWSDDARVFLGRFQKVWDSLPFGDRQVMFAFWEKRILEAVASGADRKSIRLIQLSETVFSLSERCACVFSSGVMAFRPSAILNAPDFAVCSIIAHELAHVMQFATNWTENQAQIKAAMVVAAEIDAHARCDAWGWPRCSIAYFYASDTQASIVAMDDNSDGDRELILEIIDGFQSKHGNWDRVRIVARECIEASKQATRAFAEAKEKRPR